MKNINKFLAMSFTLLMLFGCSAPKNPESSETSPAVTGAAEDIQTVLPVLSIETKNSSDDAIKFVTEPVDQYVAEQIASWTPFYKMPPAPYYEECSVTLKDADGETMLSPCDAQIKVRGNWTTVYPKKPLKIKFAEKQNLLGLNDGAEQKNWLLLAEYKDASMLRNKAALYAAHEILSPDGLYSADSGLVNVEINGEYFGTYLLTESQQISSERVDISEPDNNYTGTDTGYFLEFDGYFTNEDELHSFPLDLADNAPLKVYDGTDSETYMQALPTDEDDAKKPVGITIKSTINSQEQHDFIENFVNNVYTIMYEAAYNDKAYVFDKDFKNISETSTISPQQAVENVVDVQSLADMYIISELTCDADIYWSSFFMDADFGADGSKKLRFEAPWDFDSAMGNKDRCIDGTGFYASNVVPDVNGGTENGGEYDTINPWLVVLANEDWYQDIVRKKWSEAYDSGVFERTFQLIEDDKTAFSNDLEKNYQKWSDFKKDKDLMKELSAPAAKCKNEAESADFLLEWLKKRVDFLNSQWHE